MVNEAWVALSLTNRLGGKTFQSLLLHFQGNLDAILTANQKDLQQVVGVGPKIAQSIVNIDREVTARKIARWQSLGIQIVTWNDPDYPHALRDLTDAPPTLFIRGQYSKNKSRYAVIGTRNPSPQSEEAAMTIGALLSQNGCVVVSGLALGVDRCAHLGVMSVPQAEALAVLGSGVLNIYPPENYSLANAVMSRGALLSELAPDTPVSSSGLVARNRLITGLCDAVIVIETEIDGGAMHAARFAKMQGRPIYALRNEASGNRALLDNGALEITVNIESLLG